MINYREIREKLISEIEEEQGFSWKKFIKIIELDGILKGMEQTVS